MSIQLPTAGLLVILERKLLLAFSRNKQCFYLPGGKIDPGENAKQALCREIAEELNVQLSPGILDYYTHISAPAFGEANDVVMEQDCFLIHEPVSPVAGAEIGVLKYFSLQEYLQENYTAPGVIMLLKQLAADGLID